ncbi:amidase [Conexibacter sp. W3-3-2]|uniref:amidase n=1 Tax=Conexibacter sp. W3-3-2 TaxID=2675227 RepID=UPI0012B9E6DE|nr:amidase [Conexibacter sp. W3-3-2]MTD43869.1 amidase [Conexibacter sp. W3-3-2]
MDATDLAFAGAARQAELIAQGEVSSRELTELMLERIARIDPRINAYRVVLAEQALAEADAADARRAKAFTATGRRRKGSEDPGILNGVPLAIKDDADLAGEPTAWGTAAHGPAKTEDAEVVRRLRAAGGVVLGKTHVPEMTAMPYTESMTFGATRNPWQLDRTPGGSSGGTAAAVAAGLAGLGLGSDGGGSIRIPSAFCGLFGIKPQRDRVPLAPHDDAWQGMSVNGPLARTVADAALFLDATTTLPAPEGGFLAATASDPGPLRIALSTAVPAGSLPPSLGPDQQRGLAETAELLRSLGHTVVERDIDWPLRIWQAVNLRIVRGIGDDVADAMPERHRLERRVRAAARIGQALPPGLVRWAREAEPAMTRKVAAIFDDVDVVLTPMMPRGPFAVGAWAHYGLARLLAQAPRWVAYAAAVNVTGLPACSVPAGFDGDGLPVAVQLLGPQAGEERLLALAGQLERERPWAQHRPAIAA